MSTWLVLTVAFGVFALPAGCWLGWQMLRQNGRLLLRLEELENRLDELEFGEREKPAGLPLGIEAPAFELPDLAGDRKSLAQYRGQPLLLVFFNPACDYCRDMAPKLAAFSSRSRRSNEADEPNPRSEIHNPKSYDRLLTSAATNELPQIIILTTGDAEKNREFFREHKLQCPVLLQNDGEVAKAYQANGTPTGYLVSADGKVASELAIGAKALLKLATSPRSSRREEAPSSVAQPSTLNSQPEERSLVTSAATNGDGRASRFGNRPLARSKIKRDGLKAGTPAPDFRLPRLDGRGELSLEEFRGRRVLLVFSSPHCGPCNMVAPELEKFHRQQRATEHHLTLTLSPAEGERESANGVAVVMISKGELKENRAKVKQHGLTFPVVLQQQWEISRRYAMFATPIAYLINEQGVISNDVAVGVEPILALMKSVTLPTREMEPAMH